MTACFKMKALYQGVLNLNKTYIFPRKCYKMLHKTTMSISK